MTCAFHFLITVSDRMQWFSLVISSRTTVHHIELELKKTSPWGFRVVIAGFSLLIHLSFVLEKMGTALLNLRMPNIVVSYAGMEFCEL